MNEDLGMSEEKRGEVSLTSESSLLKEVVLVE